MYRLIIIILFLILSCYTDTRERDYKFMMEEYGNTPLKVGIQCTNYTILNHDFLIHKKAYNSLDTVFKNVKTNKEVISFLKRVEIQTYNWRTVSNEVNLSPHCFGIALDFVPINENYEGKIAYWKWTRKNNWTNEKWTPPKQLIDEFRKNNFIWGGDWDLFDTVHFEWRPELNNKDI